MRRVFGFRISKDFDPPYNKEGMCTISREFRQPIKEIRPLVKFDKEKRKLERVGFEFDFGYKDYATEEEFQKDRKKELLKRMKLEKTKIEECKQIFKDWLKGEQSEE